jgi:choline dehydrogenase-like flavoprotein
MSGQIDDVVDIVVVGSGAGGATCAKNLANAGFDVALVEEGSWVDEADFDANVWRAMKRTFRDFGTTYAQGKAIIPVLQGRCVGGTTVINSAICWRTPEDVLDSWRNDFGLQDTLRQDRLEAAFDAIEKDLSVAPTPESVFSESDRIMKAACSKVGLRPEPTARNVKDCEGSGLCLQGCQGRRKQSMAVTYVPEAQKAGAQVFTRHRVERVILKNGVAIGVEGKVVPSSVYEHRDGRRFKIGARKAVVMAASAVQTPLILMRSGLCMPEIGMHFQGHPGVGVLGFFPQKVRMWDGATQGFQAVPPRSARFKLETLALPPELLAVRLPGLGRELMKEIANLEHAALWAVLVRSHAEGRIVPSKGFQSPIRFSIEDRDLEIYANGISMACRMMLEAGAEYVMPGIYGFPDRLTSIDQLEAITPRVLDATKMNIVMTHYMSSCRMGASTKYSAVNPSFETWEIERLFVADASVLPTNMGVNPQHTIVAMAWLASERIASILGS